MRENYPQVFINYSASDNESKNNQPGWVESFSYVLRLMTTQILRDKTNIALRQDFKENEINSDLLKEVRAFVNIFSESYNQDNSAQKISENFTSNKDQVIEQFAVLKSPIAKEIAGKNYYEFYSQNDQQNGEAWNPDLETEHSKDYWLKVVDLSYDIAKALKTEKTQYSKSVFIAETIPEQKSIRDAVKRDLQRHGFKVLPESPLPTDKDLLKEQIIKDLKESVLSVHILGDKYGDKKILKNISIVDFQNKVAAEFCHKNTNNLSRVIWLSPDYKNTDLEQNEYLDQLRKNKDELSSAELIQTPIELLKSIILDHLEKGGPKSEKKVKLETKEVESIKEGGVYIIHDSADKESVKPLIDWFKKNDFEVHSPDFDLQHYKLMLDHKQKLIKSDSILVYCNHGNIQWSKTKIKDIIKAPGFGRNKPFQFKSLYLASDKNLDLKTQVEESDFIILENTDKFSASMMSNLLSKVK